jgi:hypothetical protein
MEGEIALPARIQRFCDLELDIDLAEPAWREAPA